MYISSLIYHLKINFCKTIHFIKMTPRLDMGPLIFDVVHGPSLLLLGRVRLVDVSQLSASAPIQG